MKLVKYSPFLGWIYYKNMYYTDILLFTALALFKTLWEYSSIIRLLQTIKLF